MLNVITGFMSGIISGMGIGGGAVLIPALIMFEGVSQKVAQWINLIYFIPTAIISLFVHIKNKRVDKTTALIIGGAGVPGAVIGSLLANGIKGGLLRRGFGVFLLIIGIYEIYKGFRCKNC